MVVFIKINPQKRGAMLAAACGHGGDGDQLTSGAGSSLSDMGVLSLTAMSM
jgi:hypothetical protein